MRILVVEDDRDLNKQLSQALRDAGYIVDYAFNGEEGHFLGDTEPYDAVVLDIGLPRLDGLSRARAMAARRAHHAGAAADRARPLVRQGAGDRRRRRRLCGEAVPHRGGAGAGARAGAPRRRARLEHARLRTGAARPEGEPRDGRRRAGQAHLARIQGARISDAPSGQGDLAHRADRASLRPGFRPRFEHDRGVRRPAPEEARRRSDRDGARHGLSDRARTPSSPEHVD